MLTLFLLRFDCFSQIIIKEDTVQCSIYFNQGKFHFNPAYRDNGIRLKEFVNDVYFRDGEPSMSIKKVVVNSGASPEGGKAINDRLSRERAAAIISYLKHNTSLNDSMVVVHSPGVDWEGLVMLVEKSDEIPDKDAVLEILLSDEFGNDDIARRKRLETLNGGSAYKWMYRNLFPLVRHSKASIVYVSHFKKELYLAQVPEITYCPKFTTPDKALLFSSPLRSIVPVQQIDTLRPFYMSIQTNLLYDVACTPNIGVEFYLGKDFSIDANWMYAWWHSDASKFYWRIYGGDLSLRYWFGRAAKMKPLTGHHIGVYGQVLTYDFCFGEHGIMGGKPSGTLLDKANFSVGLEYGYSVPVAKRLNFDFTIGLGYHWGEYHEYMIVDDCYLWEATKNRRWIGPTKAEISLVWLIGRGNINKRKGGER